jgi:hypothetical protein
MPQLAAYSRDQIRNLSLQRLKIRVVPKYEA